MRSDEMRAEKPELDRCAVLRYQINILSPTCTYASCKNYNNQNSGQVHPPLPPAAASCFVRQFAPDADSDTVDADKIPEEWMGLDVGPKTVAAFSAALAPCKTVVSTYYRLQCKCE